MALLTLKFANSFDTETQHLWAETSHDIKIIWSVGSSHNILFLEIRCKYQIKF